MTKTLILIILISFFSIVTFAQNVTIKGISLFPNQSFFLYKMDDPYTKNKILLDEVFSDSIGRFTFIHPIDKIEKLIIKSSNIEGFIYAEPGNKYYIEFLDIGLSNFVLANEAEINFINLDSNDINYKILTFESWLDNALVNLHQLKERNSGEFIKEINQFKNAVNILYGSEQNIFLTNYYKYSLGITVEELNGFNANSNQEKFDFFFQNAELDLSNEKFFDYIKLFYKNYFFELGSELRLDLIFQLKNRNFVQFNSLLQQTDFVDTKLFSELVGMVMLEELLKLNYIDKNDYSEYLNYLSFITPDNGLYKICINQFNKLNILENGMSISSIKIDNLNWDKLKNKYVYLHFFKPNNIKCISEIEILKSLYKKYSENIEFITIYPKQPSYSDQEIRYINSFLWNTYEVENNNPIWRELRVNTFPNYTLVNKNSIIQEINAKSPSPNGIYSTIETLFYEIKIANER